MSFSHQVTFKCDACETNFMIDEEAMELPPGWLGMQVVVADTDGCVPEHEREIFCHFCSQDCLIDYSSSSDLRHRLAMADKPEASEDSDEDDL